MFDPIAYNREYHSRPDVKERMKQYNQRPEVKASRVEYRNRPEVKARTKAYMAEYNRRPEVKARQKAYMQSPKAKEHARAHQKVYFQRPEVKAYHRRYQETYRRRPEVIERENNRRKDMKYVRHVCATRAIKRIKKLGYSDNVAKALIMDGTTLDYQLKKYGIRFKRGKKMR